MQKPLLETANKSEYSVTLYGCSSFDQISRENLAKVFGEVLDVVLASSKSVVDAQYDYNRIVDKYEGTPLPLTAAEDEKAIVERWENAYKAAFDAAFVAVFGDLQSIPEEAHFEIEI